MSTNDFDRLTMIDEYIKMVTNTPDPPTREQCLTAISGILKGALVMKSITTYILEPVDPNAPIARGPEEGGQGISGYHT
jgi:hypothetical protein